ncbi:MAG: hypothetical protein HXY37_17685 [Chloroflexi bacterium]|nr:hypothetical protein [Chloroflexota bacterium]
MQPVQHPGARHAQPRRSPSPQRTRRSRPLRWLALGILLLALSACAGGGGAAAPTATPAPAVLVPNASAYAAMVGEQFAMNLALEYLRRDPLAREEIVAVELLPPAELVTVTAVERFAQSLGNIRARVNLALELRAEQPGAHTFTSIVVRTTTGRYELPAGSLAVTVVEGRSPGFYAVFQTRGLQDAPGPLALTLVNPTAATYRFRELVPANPALSYDTDAVSLTASDGSEQPLPPDGLTLPPGARQGLTVNWQVDLPKDTPLSIELRPLARLDGPEGPVYVPMANIMYRNLPATRPVS